MHHQDRADVERYDATGAELRDDHFGPGPQARIIDGEEIPGPADVNEHTNGCEDGAHRDREADREPQAQPPTVTPIAQ